MQICPARPKVKRKVLWFWVEDSQPHKVECFLLAWEDLFWSVHMRCKHCKMERIRHCSDQDLLDSGFKKIPNRLGMLEESSRKKRYSNMWGNAQFFADDIKELSELGYFPLVAD